MDTFASAVDLPLYWVQPSALERRFELRADERLLGSLHFESAWGTRASAESYAGHWTFKRVGFLNPRVTVRQAGTDTDVAVYWPKFWGDGILELPGGKRFHWKSVSFWGRQWGFADTATEELLFTLKPGTERPKLSDLLKNQAVVEIQPHGQEAEDLPLLVLLGWYLMILHQEDSVAATAAATAATAT